MGPTRVLSAPDGPHVSPMNLAIRGDCHTHMHLMEPGRCGNNFKSVTFNHILHIKCMGHFAKLPSGKCHWHGLAGSVAPLHPVIPMFGSCTHPCVFEWFQEWAWKVCGTHAYVAVNIQYRSLQHTREWTLECLLYLTYVDTCIDIYWYLLNTVFSLTLFSPFT